MLRGNTSLLQRRSDNEIRCSALICFQVGGVWLDMLLQSKRLPFSGFPECACWSFPSISTASAFEDLSISGRFQRCSDNQSPTPFYASLPCSVIMPLHTFIYTCGHQHVYQGKFCSCFVSPTSFPLSSHSSSPGNKTCLLITM
jgi:hypothetical protein